MLRRDEPMPTRTRGIQQMHPPRRRTRYPRKEFRRSRTATLLHKCSEARHVVGNLAAGRVRSDIGIGEVRGGVVVGGGGDEGSEAVGGEGGLDLHEDRRGEARATEGDIWAAAQR